jgi:hypothetical protein
VIHERGGFRGGYRLKIASKQVLDHLFRTVTPDPPLSWNAENMGMPLTRPYQGTGTLDLFSTEARLAHD